MMWIVRLALRRPYSIGVMSLFILIMGILSIKSMIVDIFPVIDIPVVSMIWSYQGLSALEMERRVVLISERGTSTSVGGVDHIESQSQPGIGILKVYFQKGTDISAAIAQMSATASTSLRSFPGARRKNHRLFDRHQLLICVISSRYREWRLRRWNRLPADRTWLRCCAARCNDLFARRKSREQPWTRRK